MRRNRNLLGLALLLTLASPACHKQPTLGGACLLGAGVLLSFDFL